MFSPRSPVALGFLALAAVALLVLLLPSSAPASATGANSITRPDTGDIGGFTSLALDAAGFPVISYTDFRRFDLRVLHCGNANCTSGNSIASPDDEASTAYHISLALDASGYPVVAYVDVTNDDLKVLHCGDVDCASDNVITTVDSGLGDLGGYLSLALDASGYPVISYWYWDRPEGGVWTMELRILRCGDANCTSGSTITSPDSFGVGSPASLVLDASGYPVVSYQGPDSALRVLHCGSVDCTANNSIVTPEGSGKVFYQTSLALDATGRPVVAYGAHGGSGDLKVLHCGDENCASENSVVSADTGDVGWTMSLALDGSDYPVIAYSDGADDLKVLHCGDVNCSSGNGITVPDTVASVGRNASLALDASGYPVVSYLDDTNRDLKVLHCGDANCSTKSASPKPHGDANCDSRVNAIDAAVILQYLAGRLQLLPCEANADADGDGAVIAIDATLLLQYSAGLLDGLPP